MGYFTRNNGIIGNKKTTVFPGVQDGRALKRGDGSIVGTDQVPTLSSAPERWDLFDEYLYDSIGSWPVAYGFQSLVPADGSFTQLENAEKTFNVQTINIPVGTVVYWCIVHDTTVPSDFYNSQDSGSFVIGTTTVSVGSYIWTNNYFTVTTSFTGNTTKGVVKYQVQVQLINPSGSHLYKSSNTPPPQSAVSQSISIPSIQVIYSSTDLAVTEGYSSGIGLTISNVGTKNLITGSIKTSSDTTFSGTTGPYASFADFSYNYGNSQGFPTAISLNLGLNEVNINLKLDTITEGTEYFYYQFYYNNIPIPNASNGFARIVLADVITGNTDTWKVIVSSPTTLLVDTTAEVAALNAALPAGSTTFFIPVITYGPSNINTENSLVTVTITVTGVNDGAIFYWKIIHGTTTIYDFIESSGRTTITSGSGQFQIITRPRFITSGTTQSTQGNLGKRDYRVMVSSVPAFTERVITSDLSYISAPTITAYWIQPSLPEGTIGYYTGGTELPVGIYNIETKTTEYLLGLSAHELATLYIDIGNFGSYFSNFSANVYLYNGSANNSQTGTTSFLWASPSNATGSSLVTTVTSNDIISAGGTDGAGAYAATLKSGRNYFIVGSRWDPRLVEKTLLLEAVVAISPAETTSSGNYIAVARSGVFSFTNWPETSKMLAEEYLGFSWNTNWLVAGVSRGLAYSSIHNPGIASTEYNDSVYGYGSAGLAGITPNDGFSFRYPYYYLNGNDLSYIRYHNQGFVTFDSNNYATNFGVQNDYWSSNNPVSGQASLHLGSYGSPYGIGRANAQSTSDFGSIGSGLTVDVIITSGLVTGLVLANPGSQYLNGTSGTLTFTVNKTYEQSLNSLNTGNLCTASISVRYGVPYGSITIINSGLGYSGRYVINSSLAQTANYGVSITAPNTVFGFDASKSTTTQTYYSALVNANCWMMRIESRATTGNKDINSPTMVVEAYFWKPIAAFNYLPIIEVVIGTNSRVQDGLWGLSAGGLSMDVTFSGTPNTSYVLIGTLNNLDYSANWSGSPWNGSKTSWAVVQGYLLNTPY